MPIHMICSALVLTVCRIIFLNAQKGNQTKYQHLNEGEYNLGGAKANSTCISNSISPYFVVGDSHNNIRLYAFDTQEEISVLRPPLRFTMHQQAITFKPKSLLWLSAAQKKKYALEQIEGSFIFGIWSQPKVLLIQCSSYSVERASNFSQLLRNIPIITFQIGKRKL